MKKKVFVGIGHGGSDAGAVANGLKESNLALDIGMRLNKILKAAGVFTLISRTADVDDDLSDKIARCNVFDPDLALDIHINAGGGEGWEAFVYSGGGTSKLLAQNIEQEVKKFTISRGLKTRLNSSGADYFGFIRQIKAPSVILEAAFIDNLKDVERIKTGEGRQKFAEAYSAGILKTLGIKTTEEHTLESGGGCRCRKVYKALEEVPETGRATVKKLIDKGLLKGDSSPSLGLNLSEELVRMLVINDRAGLYK